ncbi:hypothetical protein OIU92_27255 [Escherichia coli]|nr:hypothetical protein [Escherichia coli]
MLHNSDSIPDKLRWRTGDFKHRAGHAQPGFVDVAAAPCNRVFTSVAILIFRDIMISLSLRAQQS